MAQTDGHLNDIPLLLKAQLPCQQLTVGELLALEPGTVISSSRAAGDSVDVRIGDQMVAQAELIVIDNRLAVRLSEFTERN